MMISRFVTLVLSLTAGTVFAADPVKYSASNGMPKAAEKWKVELVQGPPIVRWPSVVECAPDGRIFVAEDAMDMPGPGDKPIDRILCIHPDGHVTVFAEHLYAVFGLRYIDGKVYVHHTPKLTVFTDDNGVGKDPKDIWDSDNPAPWNFGGSFNDHIPSNLRLGMDNYFYISTGDKGIFGLKSNVDGKTVEIHGGGVMRVRPDGRDAEVYCTGTRNHLDVEINAEDEIFTYDNTDDGRGWWTRYTHMVDGGYYGYPHDYRPEDDNVKDMEWYRSTKGTLPYRPWTLWRIDETGGGSAVGGTGYNEDALPEEYRGNTFNCEWGKGKLQRFYTVRDGGTYKIVALEDVLTGTGNFRPLGISVTPDGTGFYIADWEYGGWKANAVKGRLLKLTFTGEMHPAPKPAWYIPAAEGRPFTATNEELIAGLKHPAQSVRLVAQRRLADRHAGTDGKNVTTLMVDLLNDAKAPAAGRWHAIWTLDLIDGGKEARAAIIAVAKDDKADLSVRMQAVRQLGTRRADEATEVCIALLNHDNPAMRFRAATSLGRIGNIAAVAPLIAKLEEPDFFAHYAVFTALKRIGQQNAKAWQPIVEAFASKTPKVREGVPLVIHEVYDKALAETLSTYVQYPNNASEARAAALHALAEMHRQRPAWDGRWWGTQPQRTPAPAKSVDWGGTAVVLSTLESCLKDTNAIIRKSALESLQVAPDPAAAGMLVQMFNNETDGAVRKEILHALATTKSPDALSIVTPLLKDPKANADLVADAVAVAEGINNDVSIEALIALASTDNSPEILSSAFGALGRLRAHKAVVELAKQAANANTPVAQSALAALGAIGGKDAAKELISAVADKRPEIRKAAVTALGATQDASAIPVLVQAAKDPATQVDAITALTKRPDGRAADAYIDGLGTNDGGLRSLCRKAMEQIGAAGLPAVESRLDKGPPLTRIAISELQRIYTKLEPMKNWQIVGPFTESTTDAMSVASIKDLNHLPKDLKGADGKVLEWKKPSTTREGFVDLAAQFDPHEHVYAYAVAEMNSPLERDLALTMGSDDGLALYLNGQEIFKDLNNHGWQVDAFHVNVHLIKGRNIFVAKITQDSGPWGFSVNFTAERTGKLFELDTKSTDLKTYDAYATGHEGDPKKGATLFNDAKGLGCIKCHVVNNKGGIVGPDLSGVALKYNRAQIIESVLYPSKQIESGYEQTLIRTKDGNVQAGVVRGETDKDVTLYDSSANKIVVRKVDIDVRKTSPVSVMPEGLQAALSHQQFADLIAYLQSLKEALKK